MSVPVLAVSVCEPVGNQYESHGERKPLAEDSRLCEGESEEELSCHRSKV